VDCIVPPDSADLAKEKEGGAVKRRVVAITEGKWNDTVFRPDELDKVPENTERRKGRDARKNLNVPLVIDHSDDLLKRIGTTLAMTTGTVEKDGKQIKALILDHEFQQTTSVQKDVVALVKAAPDEILFSIRVGGDLKYDGATGEYYWTDLWVDHNSVVTSPACANTGIVEELAKKRSDSPFYAAPEKSHRHGTRRLRKAARLSRTVRRQDRLLPGETDRRPGCEGSGGRPGGPHGAG